jgi:hypothetical protein
LRGRFVNDPMTEATIRMALGSIYIRIIESAEAETQWRRVVDLLAHEVGPGDARLIESRYWLAEALTLQSKFAEAKSALTLADNGRAGTRLDANLDLVAQRSERRSSRRHWMPRFSRRPNRVLRGMRVSRCCAAKSCCVNIMRRTRCLCCVQRRGSAPTKTPAVWRYVKRGRR